MRNLACFLLCIFLIAQLDAKDKPYILIWILATDFGQSRLSVGSQRFESKTACENGGRIMENWVTKLDDTRASLTWKCTPAE